MKFFLGFHARELPIEKSKNKILSVGEGILYESFLQDLVGFLKFRFLAIFLDPHSYANSDTCG